MDLHMTPEDLAFQQHVRTWFAENLPTKKLETLDERKAFRELLAFGLEDTFRRLYPEVQKFSWWDYRMLAFPKNKGVRIDHILASAPLMARCREVDVDRETRKGAQPSDHAAVWARFE